MVAMWRIGAVLGAATLAAGCSSITEHRGYLMDEVLISAIEPGLDNQASVRGTLGQPTLTSQFGTPVWYYISSTTDQEPFTTPDIATHSVLAVKFDSAGNVVSAQRTGMEQVVHLNPDGDKTPTLGREKGFLESLFGNIGTVGTGLGGTGAPGG